MPLPAHLQTPLHEIITRLITHSTNTQPKRVYSELFQELPDPTWYPDYYVLIQEPRSLNAVLASLNNGLYSSPQIVAYDLLLIWANAKTYNQEGSVVYADADKLETCMQDLWNGRSPPLPPWRNLPPAGSLAPPRKLDKAARRALKLANGGSESHKDPHRKKDKHKSSSSVSTSHAPAVAHPAPASSSTNASTSTFTFKIPSKISIPAVSNLSQASQSHPTPSVVASRTPLPPSFASRSHSQSTSASPLVFQTQSTPTAVASSSSASIQPPSIAGFTQQPPIKQESRKIKLTRPKIEGDDSSSSFNASTPLTDSNAPILTGALSLDASTPSSSLIKLKSRKVGLDSIADDAETGWMQVSAGQEQQEAFRWVARELREYRDVSGRLLSTPLYSLPDRVSRPDYYNAVPDPIALDVIDQRIASFRYSSPDMFDRDLSRLFSIARMFIKPETPGTHWRDLMLVQRRYHELTKPGASPLNLASHTSTTIELGIEKTYLSGVHFKGDFLKVGDWIHLINPQNPTKPIIACIFKIYRKTGSPDRFLNVCWYLRPEETVHNMERTFYESEVFKSSRMVDHPVEDFLERCFVMSIDRYRLSRPSPPLWNLALSLYVCESRYKGDTKMFKKIKAWESCLPDLVKKEDYQWIQHEGNERDAPIKVKSPFMRGIVGTGGIEVSEAVVEDSKKSSARALTTPSKTLKIAPISKVAPSPTASTVANGSHQPSQSALQALDQPGVNLNLPPMTISQVSVLTEKFERLPRSLQRKFKCDSVTGDLLWFSAPPLIHESTIAINDNKRRKLTSTGHSLDYLMWKAERLGIRMKDRMSVDEDLVMNE